MQGSRHALHTYSPLTHLMHTFYGCIVYSFAMDDFRSKTIQIDDTAQRAKDEADRVAQLQKQALADQEIDRVRREAEDTIAQIQKEAQQ